MDAAPRPSEALIAWIWQTQRVRGPLRCSNGRAVQVVFPGRVWGERQPDFQGALLAWDEGELARGDVEIHVRQRAWCDHGHDRDPAYNGVILHVVLDGDGVGATPRADGREIATLELRSYLSAPLELLEREFAASRRPPDRPCQDQSERVQAVVEAAGVSRLLAKSAAFEADLEIAPPSQLLWRGVARALGYTANAAAMTRLAEMVPYARVRDVLRSRTADSDATLAVLAVLLGSAGLLPSQRGLWSLDALGEQLERRWSECQEHGWGQCLDAGDWDLGRVRPANAPPRRLAALACYALAWQRGDVVGELARLVLGQARPSALIQRFVVEAPAASFAELVDLRTTARPAMQALVGRDRAIQIVVNAVLPLMDALGRYWDISALSTAARALFAACPGSSASGLERGMARQLLGADSGGLARGARRQQGLLHLYHATCHQHACETCAGNAAAAGDHVRGDAASSAPTPLAMVPTRS